jgi:hypothetical protein
MISSSISSHFWAEVVSTATYLINIQPSSSLQGGIPYEHLCGKLPDYSSLHLFGCVCYVLLAPHERTKLIAQSVQCIFLGYSAEHNGYRCWDPVGRQMRISWDVTFDESRPFYPRTSPDSSHASVIEPLSFLLFPDTPSGPIFSPHLMPSSEAPVELRVVPSPVEPSSMAPSPVVPSFLEAIPQASMGNAYDSKPPVTRVYTRTRWVVEPSSDALSPPDEPSSSNAPSPFYDTTSDACSLHPIRPPNMLHFAGTVLSEPTSYHDAIQHQEWQHDVVEEIVALERTSTWDLVPIPAHVRPITCKWVYKVKTRTDGSLERYEARLMARGFQQEHG